ncbi:ankyrin repeat domain-containing protein [Acidovorax sp. Root275]|uniref:ankyrin repeat domain-containing protein n=1 Tax=Acidovorax sp. Root275 TaxID=1736508 RepID=UPI00112512C2|nr:ankyrin repeat domain-containing protein [Acidovorax sp. Root275]
MPQSPCDLRAAAFQPPRYRMQQPTILQILFFCWFSVFSQAAAALDCAETLLGDYALEENGTAVLRVERANGRIHTRHKDDNGQWSTRFFEGPVLPSDQVRRVMDVDPADRSAPLCGLGMDGGVLFQLPVGHEYAVSSATEKSTVPRKVLSGYLYYEASGFAMGATDLFPVARVGVSPPVPPAPAAAVSGREVPVSATCPGQIAPDMGQAAFDALPSGQKNWFHRLDTKAQTRFVCGQYLNDLMSLSTHLSAALDAPRGDTLTKISALLRAGQVPRNADGKASWSSASQSLLASNQGTRGEKIPFQDEFNALFAKGILPRLDDGEGSEHDLHQRIYLLKEVILMPPDLGVAALRTLNRRGLLRRSPPRSSQSVALQLLQFSTPRIPAETFDYLLAEAGPSAANDDGVMTTLIDTNGIEGVRRMLHAGASPAQRGWLARARMNPAAASGIYPLLLDAAVAAAKANPAQARILADQTTLVLGKLLAQCSSDPARWKEIDFLVAQGARVQGVFDNQEFSETNLGVFARRCPEGFKGLLQRGLPLNVNYPYPKYAGQRQDTPLLMYLTVGMEDHPPQAQMVVEMLSRHNNANVRPTCPGCNPLNPLEMAIFFGDVATVKALLDFGADPNDPNSDGRPPFIRAVIENSVEKLEVMNAKTPLDVHRLDKKNISLLAWANCAGAKDAAAWLSGRGVVSSGEALCQKR